MKNIHIIGLILALVFISCKKYPEGGRISNLSRTEKRIIGAYGIVNLEVNGVDTSLAGNPLYYCSGPPISFVCVDDNEKKVQSNCGTFPTNFWSVTGDKRNLVIDFFNTSGAQELYPIAINKNITVTWTIQRLHKDDLWLKTVLFGREYHLELQYIH
ncbi:MAG: hypothetical protein H0U27_02860 [Nitrosopumilus sp.]|nr:hypothetical protein [Nitrosopumilus sp.]